MCPIYAITNSQQICNYSQHFHEKFKWEVVTGGQKVILVLSSNYNQ